MVKVLVVLILVVAIPSALAADYPEMVGVWKGHLRTISSGPGLAGQIAKGGAMINEADATVTIEHQDQESFLGKVRLSTMTKNDPSVRLWGAIRSNGEEATFMGSDGTRGPIWFINDTSYEFCVTNMTDNEVMTAYCGVFTKHTEP
jgi:hypothetical protein